MVNFSHIDDLYEAMMKDPSRAPDQKSDDEAAGGATARQSSVLHDLVHLNEDQAKTIIQALTTIAHGEPLNDKELLLEHGVSMLQTLPPGSGLGDMASKDFIRMLWNDLPHPAVTMAGPTAKWRQHDGGGNNPYRPDLGRAGTPYSRNVPPQKPKGPNLPDPQLVFEQLLKRNDNEPFRKHPSGLNRLFFSYATIVIHECFQTNRTNQWINDTSSYVDLSTLYGNTKVEQARVRTGENGLIYNDSVASERIMMMPPGVIALVILFSRNHNSIAQSLLSIDESGLYGDWDKNWDKLSDRDKYRLEYRFNMAVAAGEMENLYPGWDKMSLSDKKKKWQDEDIFQTARNINVGFFATIVLKDYVAAILNTPRAKTDWWLNLGEEIKHLGQRVERGTGNVVSVEFAVLYHWHAALSKADADWMGGIIKGALGGKSLDEVTAEDYFVIEQKLNPIQVYGKDARKWQFEYLKRDPKTGKFNDSDLAGIIKNCINEPAHAFGAHGTPNSLRIVDILGIQQARNIFNTCTMNEFRKYLNLQAYKTFEEWNPDKEVARAAELLYGHIDNLELYPGLMAECTKPAMPGSGVCPGQTTGRGILDDAVSLVRGDRYLSYDLNSNTLTNWGLSKLGDSVNGPYGSVLPHLLYNGLPNAFTGTSLWALLPFYTPEAAEGILKGNGALANFDTKEPQDHPIAGVFTQEGCKKVFDDRSTFKVPYPADFILGWDDQKKHDDRTAILHKAFFEEGFEDHVRKFFSENVARLIQTSSLHYSGKKRSINIVRDVTNVTPIVWLAERFALPMKTIAQPRGIITIPQAFEAFTVLFIYQAFNILPESEWKLREGAMKAAPVLRQIFQAHLESQQGFKETFVDFMAKGTAFEVGPVADRLYHALNKTKLPQGDLVSACLGIATAVAGKLTQQAALLIDLFLKPGYEDSLKRITLLAQKDDKESMKELEAFVFEGMRHAGLIPGLPRVATKDTVVQDGANGEVKVAKGQTVLIATSHASMDPKAFKDPQVLSPTRGTSDGEHTLLLGHGLHHCFGAQMVGAALGATLKEVFKLKNLKRASGTLGRFTTVDRQITTPGPNGEVATMKYYLDANARESPIPTSLTLEYEE